MHIIWPLQSEALDRAVLNWHSEIGAELLPVRRARGRVFQTFTDVRRRTAKPPLEHYRRALPATRAIAEGVRTGREDQPPRKDSAGPWSGRDAKPPGMSREVGRLNGDGR